MEIKLQELIKLGWNLAAASQAQAQAQSLEFEEITEDSRKASPHTLFFAFDGAASRGIDYLEQVTQKGAAAVFADKKYEGELRQFYDALVASGRAPHQIPLLLYHVEGQGLPAMGYRETALQTMKALFKAGASKTGDNKGGNQPKGLQALGITGTNGKSTIALGLYNAIRNLGGRAASIGTLGSFVGEERRDTGLTTPPLTEIHNTIGLCRRRGVEFLSIEASSHGLDQGRLDGVDWAWAIFTNLTPDHRDYHSTMENYYLSKRKLFEATLKRFDENREGVLGALVNTGDQYGLKLYNWVKGLNPEFPLFALAPSSSHQAATSTSEICNPAYSLGGSEAELLHRGERVRLAIPAIGAFNLWNYAAIYITLLELGFAQGEILETLGRLRAAPGRMEVFESRGRYAIVDYAHTPDALENVLRALRSLSPKRLHLVFGCGGDRDKEKRPAMGKIAQGADVVVLTNDNPRSEDPAAIIEAIQGGMERKPEKVISDRREAIAETLAGLKEGEAALIAGKGHEDYQILADGRIDFDDREEVRRAFALE